MNQIILRGIGPGNSQDDRTLLLIDVTLNDEVFAWELRVPPSIAGNFNEYIQSQSDKIFLDIQTKLDQWNTLSPKTREVDVGDFGEEQFITVPIQREEIVKPTYPDYYVLRAREYPSVVEQIGAMWKGGEAQQSMQQIIENIKLKYPK